MPPRREQENRTERTLGCSGRNSASPFLWFLLVRMDNQEQRGFALMLRLAFTGFSFSEGSVLYHNSGKQTGLVVRNVRFWLVSPGFSSSFPSSSSSPVACRRNRRLLLLFSTTRRCFLTPPSRRFFSPNRLAVVRFSFFSLVPALLASRDTEQVNRAHHTLHVSVFVMCSGSVFVKRRWPLFYFYVVPRCIWLK